MMLTGPCSGACAHGSFAASHAGHCCARAEAPGGSSPAPGTSTTLTSAGTLSATAGHRSAWAIRTFARLSLRTCAISSPRQCQLIGTALAPSGTVATEASRYSSELRSSSATRSPAPTPSWCNPPVARSARPNSSW